LHESLTHVGFRYHSSMFRVQINQPKEGIQIPKLVAFLFVYRN